LAIDKIPGVYKLTHVPTGTFYIGSTQNLRKRLQEHKRALQQGLHHNPRLQQCASEWGDVRATCFATSDVVTARSFENSLIRENEDNPNFANVIGPDNDKGVKKSIETRQKMSKAKIGTTRSPEVCKAISDRNKGKICSEETRERMRIAQRGTVPRAAIAKAVEFTSMAVTIYGIDYPSAASASRALDVHISSVKRRVHSKLDKFKDWSLSPSA
jgi:group I intron endonuclease